jgi:excisionase family DNA binding protein
MRDQSYTVSEFAEAERISRQMVYKLWSQGKGPRFHYVGTHRRISHEARLEWRRQLEAAASNGTPPEVA